MIETNRDSGFAAFRLGEALLSTLGRNGLTQPTPIQTKAIPPALTGSDIIGIAQTGTGKTLAFLIPIIEGLVSGARGKALILAPTRELALQIEDVAAKLARPYNYRVATLIGGASMRTQIHQLQANPSIIVATPGRLEDHLHGRTVSIDRFEVAVLDEADRMLDMGFLAPVTRILGAMKARRQTLLFSATMPSEIQGIVKQFMADPVRVEIERPGSATPLVKQELIWMTQPEKIEALDSLLKKSDGTVLVFARTRYGARKLAKQLSHRGYTAAEIHSDRTLAQRRSALHGFKNGQYRVLVATDIASRGIDVKNIELVVNYDLPDNPDDYVHRIGRTGRAGAEGVAVTFAVHDQAKLLRDIEKTIGKPIEHVGGEPPQGHRENILSGKPAGYPKKSRRTSAMGPVARHPARSRSFAR